MGDFLSSEAYIAWWQQTHDQSSAEKTWSTAAAPYRDHILYAVAALLPKSVYEIGCASGPNLRRIREADASIRLGGSEPVESFAQWAETHLGVTIDRRSLPAFVPSPTWDMVLSCYTLAYLAPTEVTTALTRLRQETRPRALVIIEPEQPGRYGLMAEQRPGGIFPPVWFHDYWALLPATGWAVQWKWPILPPQYRLRNLYVVVPRRDG